MHLLSTMFFEKHCHPVEKACYCSPSDHYYYSYTASSRLLLFSFSFWLSFIYCSNTFYVQCKTLWIVFVSHRCCTENYLRDDCLSFYKFHSFMCTTHPDTDVDQVQPLMATAPAQRMRQRAQELTWPLDSPDPKLFKHPWSMPVP